MAQKRLIGLGSETGSGTVLAGKGGVQQRLLKPFGTKGTLDEQFRERLETRCDERTFGATMNSDDFRL